MRRGPATIFRVVAFGVAGVLLWQGLTNATVYFKTVDQAVAQRAKLGTRRFRLEGIVQAGSVHAVGKGVDFVVEENNAEVRVHHEGGTPALFRQAVPAVLVVPLRHTVFDSDRLLATSTASYRTTHPAVVGHDPTSTAAISAPAA